MTRSSMANGGQAGFTVVELLVYLTLASVVVGSVFRLIGAQNANYRHQREFMDLRDNLRGALVVLSSELRQLSAAGGDIYAVSPESLTVRSVTWYGTVCEEHNTEPRYGLSQTEGDFGAVVGDSAMLFAAGITGNDDDRWGVVEITKNWSTGGGVTSCRWGGPPDRVIEIEGDTTGIKMGGPIRGFRAVQYGTFLEDGRWWIGRKTGVGGSYQRLAGPIRAPSLGGLEFRPYDALGALTADPLAVHTVEIVIRGETFGKLRGGSGGAAPTVRYDSLRTTAYLRG